MVVLADLAWVKFIENNTVEEGDIALAVIQRKVDHHAFITETRIDKKLYLLNNGPVRNSSISDGYVNLSGEDLTEPQKKFLNLGLKCHYLSKPHIETKRIETEVLIDKLQKLQIEGKIRLSTTIAQELVGESGRDRNRYESSILTKELREAAKELRSRNDLIVRRGDKSAVYVVMRRDDYDDKMDNIFNDTTKFVKLDQDPTDKLRKRITALTEVANRSNTTHKLPKIIGDFSPGYAYGTVKTHKPGNKLRPIIAQMTSPTYWTAKELNAMLTPYIPKGNTVTSPVEFLDLLKTTGPGTDMATLDVENLFTNVPIDETIDYICEKVYRGDTDAIPIPEKTMRELLYTCTSEVPFISHRGELFRQTGGVSMGSPLGCLFAEMYMAKVEEHTFTEINRPRIYVRFRDDIFVTVNESPEIETLANTLRARSVLNFTVEPSNDNTIPFLDVNVKRSMNCFSTKVYVKPTNVGRCLNANGECSEQYKRSVVSSYVNRAITHNQEWKDIDQELNRVRQLLTNNGYNGNMIEDVISHKLNSFMNRNRSDAIEKGKIITVYHKMSYGTQYENEVTALKNIVRRNVELIHPFERLSLRTFCRPKTTSSLVMRNCTAKKKPLEEETNVVYEFRCSVDACERRDVTYIGLTSTTLRRRMLAHRNNGGINSHYTKKHDRKPLLNELLENTSIIHREIRSTRLKIAEAVSIALKHPTLNTQKESDYVLPSARRRTATTREESTNMANEEPREPALINKEPPVRDPSDAPSTARQGRAEPQPAEDDDVLSERRLRPRRTRPTYTE